MLIKNIDKCINIECWNLDKDDDAYEDGINNDIFIEYRTWEYEKMQELSWIYNADISDAFYLQRILSNWGYINVTVTVTDSYYFNVYHYGF